MLTDAQCLVIDQHLMEDVEPAARPSPQSAAQTPNPPLTLSILLFMARPSLS